MAYETAMRFSELAGLKWDCVCLKEQRILVKRTWSRSTKALRETTKNGHIRTLPVSDYLRQELMKIRGSVDDFVFQFNGKPFSYDSLKSRLRTDQKKAGVPFIGIHGFRHSYASHFLMMGGKLSDLKIILGHADYSTTLRYSHFEKSYMIGKASIVSFQNLAQTKVLAPVQKRSTDSVLINN